MTRFTERLGLRRLGDSDVLQPGGGGLSLPDGGYEQDNPSTARGGYTDLVNAVDGGLIQKLSYTLDGAIISVDADDDYGSYKVDDLPNSNFIVVGARVDITAEKDGTGIGASTQPVFGVGSAPASNSTLSGAMVNFLDGVALATANPAPVERSVNQNSSPGLLFLDAGASNGIYLNAALAISADGSLEVDGTVEVWVLELGGPAA